MHDNGKRNGRGTTDPDVLLRSFPALFISMSGNYDRMNFCPTTTQILSSSTLSLDLATHAASLLASPPVGFRQNVRFDVL